MGKKILNGSSVKQILKYKGAVGSDLIGWAERWIDSWIRQNGMPPQMLSKDFVSKLAFYLSPKDALVVLALIRTDFAKAFPMLLDEEPEPIDDIE